MRWIRRLFGALLLTLVLLAGTVAVRYAAWTPATTADHVAQLWYLRHALDRGAGDRMQALFPEGDYFTHVLYGLAWTNLAQRDTSLRQEAIREASWAVARLERPASVAVFPAQQEPPHGAFYVGWLAWLRGNVLAVTPPLDRAPADTARLRLLCDQLAAAFAQRPFPTSYPGASWPPDGSSGVAALALYDRLFGPRYDAVVRRWLAQTDTLRVPPTGLFPHSVDGETQALAIAPRASSAVAIVRALAEVDSVRARADWRKVRAHFLRPRLGLLGVQEHRDGSIGRGDIDAGPLIAGVSASATVYAIGAARAVGDTATAARLDRGTEALGMGMTWNGRRRYLLGALPVGDAFLVWARTTPLPPR